MDDKNLGLKAFICYFFSLVGGALIYFTEKQNQILKFHAAQAMAFGLIYVIINWITAFIHIPFLGFALFIAYLIVVITGITKASKNIMYRFPILGEIADKIVEILK